MRLPLRKNTKNLCFLALDIGTEAVKALIFEKENKKYSILGSALEYFDELKPFDNDKVISRAKEEAAIMAGRITQSLFLSLPANILKSRIDFRSVYRKNPKKIIDKEEEAHIRNCIFREAEEKIAERFAEDSGILPSDLYFVDSEILEIKIDGYETPRLSGYTGGELKFRILSSFLPKDYFNNFTRIAANLGFKTQKILNPIKNLAEILKISEGVFLDVGGKVTQICLVKNDKIDWIGEFMRGGEDFTRAISENFGMCGSDAKILKERCSRGELTEGSRKRIEEIIVSPSREWSLALSSKLKTAKAIPSESFIFGGGGLLPEIKKLIKAEEIKLIYPQDLENIIDKTRCVNSPQFINAISLFYG